MYKTPQDKFSAKLLLELKCHSIDIAFNIAQGNQMKFENSCSPLALFITERKMP